MVKQGKAGGDSIGYTAGGKYSAPAITPDRAAQYMKNVHLATQVETMQVQLFPGAPDVWVEDVDEVLDEKLTDWMRAMFNAARGYASMQISWVECLGFGCSVKSPGYLKRANKLELTEIRNLPAYRFNQYPGHGEIQNEIMPGIIVNKSGETEVYQTGTDGISLTRIINNTIIKDPTAPEPAGEAYAAPVYPVIAAINHANKASDQQINRAGAPSIFPQLDTLSPSPNLVEWTRRFVRDWGKDTSFVVPPGVVFPDVKIRETRIADDRLRMLVEWVEAYFNPTTILQKGNSIGASDKGASQIWANYIGGTQSWIETAYEQFLQPVLDANGYEGMSVKIRLKRPELDRSAEMREQIRLGYDSHAILPDEIRDNLNELKLRDTDDKLLAELKEAYKTPASSPFGMFGNITPPQQIRIEEKTQKNIERAYAKAEKELLALLEKK